MAVQTQILHRRGTAATWTSTNPTLGAGEIGYETDTGKYKIGTGSAVWTSLAYASILPSTVTAKGDILAASAASTPAALAVGNNGETLVADSSTATGLRYQGNFAAGKNKIINGDFGIWQRGTSFTGTGAFTYTADRSVNYYNGNPTVTISRQSFTAGTAPVAGYEGQYFYRFAQSTAGTGMTYNSVYYQPIEDVRTFAGQTVTLSFWAKADAARTANVFFNQVFGSGGSSSVGYGLGSASLTTSWTRFSFTVALTSIAGKTIGTGSYLAPSIEAAALNTAQTIDIWGVQVEAGSVATAFQTATGTIQGELAACQRYYYRNSPATSGIPLGQGSANGSRYVLGVIALPVSMRVAPTSADFSALIATDGATAGSTVAALAAYGNSPTTATYYFDCTSGLTQYRNYKIETSSSSGYLGFSAEL